MKYLTVAVPVLLAVAVLAAPTALADHAQVTITINSYYEGCTDDDACYSPGAEVAIDAGAEIVWANGDDTTRSIAGSAVGGGSATADTDASDTVTLAPGDTYSLRFHEPGTYGFYDPDHPQVTGTITVQASDADDTHAHDDTGHDHAHDDTEYDDTYSRTVTVGGVFDTSGDWSLTGGEIKTAAEMAESDFNGFLRAVGADWRLDITYEDSQTSGPVALEKVTTLNGKEHKIIGGHGPELAPADSIPVHRRQRHARGELLLDCGAPGHRRPHIPPPARRQPAGARHEHHAAGRRHRGALYGKPKRCLGRRLPEGHRKRIRRHVRGGGQLRSRPEGPLCGGRA